MSQELNRYIIVAQQLVAAAQADTLDGHLAVQFCKSVLPTLLVELDLARRMDARLASMFPEPKPCEATICSGRWVNKADAAQHKKARKKAAKKARKKKEVTDDCFPS